MLKTWYDLVCQKENKTAELSIYGIIGAWDISASEFIADLKQYDDIETLNVHINSPGGDVFDGIAIYNVLNEHKAQVNIFVDAEASSIASVIVMSGDKITMYDTSVMMIHKPLVLSIGNAPQLRKSADVLDKIENNIVKAYKTKIKDLSDADLHQMMEEETWMDADEAKTFGFADEIIKNDKPEDVAVHFAAMSDNEIFKQFKNVPKKIQALVQGKPTPQNKGGEPPAVPAKSQNEIKPKIQEDVQMTPEQLKALRDKAATGDIAAQNQLKAYMDALAINPTDGKAASDAAALAAKNEERARVTDITAAGKMLNIKAEMVEKAISDGVSYADASKTFNKAVADGTVVIPKSTSANPTDEKDKFVALHTKSLMDVAGTLKDPKDIQDARTQGGARGMLALARVSLERAGVKGVAAMSNSSVAMSILNLVSQGTGDFANILADTINKSIAAGIVAAPTTYRQWTRSQSVADFKQFTQAAISNFSDLEIIAEGAAFKTGAFKDKKEVGNLSTLGKSYTISRQALINDDQSVFTRIPQLVGDSVERKINADLYTLLAITNIAGPLMTEDGYRLFDATSTVGHGNYVAHGSGAAPSSTTIGAGRKAMMTRKMLAPDPLAAAQYTNIPPKFIIAGPSLEDTINQIVYTGFLIAASTTVGQTGVYNPYGPGGKYQLTPIIEPFLVNSDSGTDAGWYLAANPASIDTAIRLTLNGNESPTLRSEPSRVGEALGISWDVYIDSGWMFGDWRGMYYNNGN
jgi:ATP-dependent protease ClpP protease subunit